MVALLTGSWRIILGIVIRLVHPFTPFISEHWPQPTYACRTRVANYLRTEMSHQVQLPVQQFPLHRERERQREREIERERVSVRIDARQNARFRLPETMSEKMPDKMPEKKVKIEWNNLSRWGSLEVEHVVSSPNGNFTRHGGIQTMWRKGLRQLSGSITPKSLLFHTCNIL